MFVKAARYLPLITTNILLCDMNILYGSTDARFLKPTWIFMLCVDVHLLIILVVEEMRQYIENQNQTTLFILVATI